MPHVIVKLWPGRSEEDKEVLAQKLAQTMTEVMGIPDKNISVSFEEVAKEKWDEEVYQPDIIAKPDLLYKKPGY